MPSDHDRYDEFFFHHHHPYILSSFTFVGLSPAASTPGEEIGGSRGASSLKLGTSPTSRRAKSFTSVFQSTAMSKGEHEFL